MRPGDLDAADGIRQISFKGDSQPVAVQPYVSNQPPVFYWLDGTPVRRTQGVRRTPHETASRRLGVGHRIRVASRPRERREARHQARSTSSADGPADSDPPSRPAATRTVVA